MLEHFRISDGCTLAYEREGQGPCIVLVPGWSQTAAMFKHQVAHLRDRFDVVAVDMRGHGESDKPEGGFRISRLAMDLHELLEYLGVEDAYLLGWSMGASVIWSYIDMFGEDHLRGLVIVDQPATLVDLPHMTADEHKDAGVIFTFPALEEFTRNLAGSDPLPTREQFLTDCGSPEIDTQLKDWLRDECLKTPAAWGGQLITDHCTHDWRDVIRRITVPTHVIGGELSLVPADSQRWIADQIDGSSVDIFSAAELGSHYMFIENPERFNRSLDSFLIATEQSKQ